MRTVNSAKPETSRQVRDTATTEHFIPSRPFHSSSVSLDAIMDLLAVEALRRHKVSVHVLAREMDSCPVVGEFPSQNDVNLAPAPALPQPDVISNMTEFKRSLPLFPLVKPHVNFMAAKL
ncbi:unnamed protein product [Ranitomeya imitator]|uniref:Uncharacterized protein n=1 Tax=Ranitomeya imitator TaxID=111125 RepID=A0ABN9KS06_9NEOB|nr:unnamed protein product [Ranitomeya imitator]